MRWPRCWSAARCATRSWRGASVTVTEVRVSPDLKSATVFVMPLGGEDEDAALAALGRAAPFLRRRVAARCNLRFAPELRFALDTTFDAADRIERLLRSPESRATWTSARTTIDDARRRGQADPRLAGDRQAAGPDLGPGGRPGAAASPARPRSAMAARSIRWRPACCRSLWARRPRPSPTSWTAPRPTASPCAGARRATPTTPRAA